MRIDESGFEGERRSWCQWWSLHRRAVLLRTPARMPGPSSPGNCRHRRINGRFAKWRNEITLRSLELYSEYEPGSFVERIAPTPLLMVVGDSDVVCPTDLCLVAFNRALEPKRLELYPGGHFSAYTDQFYRASNAACDWFTAHLVLA